MAAPLRQPLVTRRLSRPALISSKPISATSKRPHSPDVSPSRAPVKRARATTILGAPKRVLDPAKEDAKRQQKEQQEAIFRERYTKAFPDWGFYFDLDNIVPLDVRSREDLEQKIEDLGGRVERFFTVKHVTHLITNNAADKENLSRSSAANTTINMRREAPGQDLLGKAKGFNMKIWTTEKLSSVISRCLPAHSTGSRNTVSQRSLSNVIHSERIHGTSERDPNSKKNDMQYFAKGSYFMMVEDISEELAPVAVMEYSNSIKRPWPTLYCHPKSRGPFLPFDDAEKRRWEKTLLADQAREKEQNKESKEKVARLQTTKVRAGSIRNCGVDLRRSVSMNNLKRRAVEEQLQLDAGPDREESADTFVYLASGYVAASGNSVSITSNAGTTSTSGHVFKKTTISTLRSNSQREVVTRRSSIPGPPRATTLMGPPALPERHVVKKSRSMNSVRLPKRQEGSKPGYCESCRDKFDDFPTHIESRKHRRFARDDANFYALDAALSQVRRRSRTELAKEISDSFACGVQHNTMEGMIDLDL